MESNLELFDMMFASATTPVYFKPATIPNNPKGNLYVSGDSVALSPAMFAMLYANEKKDPPVDIQDINIVSIGNINDKSERIDTKTSLLQWVERLLTLMAPIKKYTQDYMLHYFLSMHGQRFSKFEIQMGRIDALNLYMKAERK